MASPFVLGACSPGAEPPDHEQGAAESPPPATAEGSFAPPTAAEPATPPPTQDVRIRVPAGAILIGDPADERASPTVPVDFPAFELDRDEVSVARFARFVEQTGYRTVAEEEGSGTVFDQIERQWRDAPGASWQHPDADPGRRAHDNLPVTLVAFADAAAFCHWAGGRLPTEFEWEYAARNAGTTPPSRYPWGDELLVEGRFMANAWQGWFPRRNTLEDGYLGASAAGAFDATPLGLHDVIGNVREWTAGPMASYPVVVLGNIADSADRAVRGGSCLCDPGMCPLLSTTAREGVPVGATLSDLGFRCAYDLPPAEASGR